MASKNFFYKINPEAVLSELTTISHDKWLQFFLDFFHDLRSDSAEGTKTDIAAVIIKESHNFKELRSKAGKASVQQKLNIIQHVLNPVATEVQQTSTSSSNSNSNNKDLTPYAEIIADLNSKGNFAYRVGEATKKLIHARFAEGFTKNDFEKVHSIKIAEWTNTDYAKFIRPETLYSNKFQGYLNQPLPKKQNEEVLF